MTSSQIEPVAGAVVPLPAAAQVRADVQRMVDFGPRLTGHCSRPSRTSRLKSPVLRPTGEIEIYGDPSATVAR